MWSSTDAHCKFCIRISRIGSDSESVVTVLKSFNIDFILSVRKFINFVVLLQEIVKTNMAFLWEWSWMTVLIFNARIFCTKSCNFCNAMNLQ